MSEKTPLLGLVLLIASSLILGSLASTSAQSVEDSKQTEKIRRQVVALKEGAQVSVKLRDKKKLTGDINYIGPDFFTMTNAKTNASQRLPYSDVVQIERKDAHGFPTWGKVVLGIVGVAFVLGMIANGGE
jgi:hypothetical protein